MKISLSPLTLDDRKSVIDIFNYYIENSYSAYPDRPFPYEFFDVFVKMSQGYPAITAKDESGTIVGFGMLRSYNPLPTFSKTAEITYFIHPDFTGQGIGKIMLDHLTEEAKNKGITTILASISALNEGSIRFHAKNGFVECGRFKNIGLKKGQVFDVVYYQKTLD